MLNELHNLFTYKVLFTFRTKKYYTETLSMHGLNCQEVGSLINLYFIINLFKMNMIKFICVFDALKQITPQNNVNVDFVSKTGI